MNNYAILRRSKLKTEKSLSDSYKHNERIYAVKNADPLKELDNIVLVDTMGISYSELVDLAISELKRQGVPSRTIRKDAVKGFEIILTFSREQADQIDIENWAQKNMDWLDKRFNPKDHIVRFIDTETGTEKTVTVQNIKHAVVHMDESKPHMHAFIVPIDDKGNLNASFYDRGRRYLQELQTDYGKAMEEFGLTRGEFHSTATPEQLSKYYNNILKAVEASLPEPEVDESAKAYKIRAEQIYQSALCKHRDEIVKINQELIHARSESGKQIASLKKAIKEDSSLLSEIIDEIAQSDVLPSDDSITLIKTIISSAKENLQFKKALEQYPDQKEAGRLLADYTNILLWMQSREEERKRKISKSKDFR